MKLARLIAGTRRESKLSAAASARFPCSSVLSSCCGTCRGLALHLRARLGAITAHPVAKRSWDLLLVAALSYLAVAVPFHLGFSSAPTRWTLLPQHVSWAMLRAQFAIDGLIWLDLAADVHGLDPAERSQILAGILAGFRSRDALAVASHLLVCSTTRLGRSVVASLPYDFLLLAFGGASEQQRLLAAALLRLPKLIHVSRVGQHARNIAILLPPSMQLAGGGARLLKALVAFVLLIHTFACAWLFISTWLQQSHPGGDVVDRSGP